MRTWMRTHAAWLLVISLIALGSLAPGTTLAADSLSLQTARGKQATERLGIYGQLSFEPAYLYVGKVVSDNPLAIVVQMNEDDPRRTAVIRIWTGIFSRHKNNLQMNWDELTIQSDGTVRQHVSDVEMYVQDFFLAYNQSVYHTAQYLGVIPWIADIPTDREAAARQVASIEDMTIYNMYGIHIDAPEGIEVPLGDPQSVRLLERAPHIVDAIGLPVDAKHNWAENYMIHLWKRGIITGYPDQTIRPANTLTRSEFIALLTRALDLPIEGTTKYGDVAGTWVQEEVAAAERAGIIPTGEHASRFRPQAEITRVEMIEMIYRAVASYGLQPRLDKASFTDTASLNTVQAEALAHTTQIGIIAGYTDGTFRPTHKLQRAEAFKVLSVLLHLIERGSQL